MKTIEVEALREQRTYAVIRLPERKFPGVVVQGDSLSTLVADLRRGRAQIERGETEDGLGWLHHLVLETLEGVQRSYEAVLDKHSIPLPY